VKDFGSPVETEGEVGDVGSLHEDGWMRSGFGRHGSVSRGRARLRLR
jgi:hypothetical protein